jgi:hypothetical protein
MRRESFAGVVHEHGTGRGPVRTARNFNYVTYMTISLVAEHYLSSENQDVALLFGSPTFGVPQAQALPSLSSYLALKF